MKISLITACYNSAGTIRTAIESVLSQKGVDVEYIVVDGGSKDGTVDIIKEYADKTLNSQLPTSLSDGCLKVIRECMMLSTRESRWRRVISSVS